MREESNLGICVVGGDGNIFILEANLAIVNCREGGGAEEERGPKEESRVQGFLFHFLFNYWVNSLTRKRGCTAMYLWASYINSLSLSDHL